MNVTSASDPGRGTGWVVVQFTLMFAILVSGPIWRGQWSGWWTWGLGFACLLISAWAGQLGKRALGVQRTPFPRPKEGGQLITTGIYARVRHPLYVSIIALGFAWALLWRSGPVLALAILQLPFFDAKARNEERWLRARFSQYNDYARRVKRFIPGLY